MTTTKKIPNTTKPKPRRKKAATKKVAPKKTAAQAPDSNGEAKHVPTQEPGTVPVSAAWLDLLRTYLHTRPYQEVAGACATIDRLIGPKQG